MEVGRRVELEGCYYEVSGPYAYQPCSYYPLLAGLARTQQMTQVLDLGTRYGGSILSVLKALDPGAGERRVLVTVDVTELNAEGLGAFPELVRIIGDSAGHETITRVLGCFRPPIDMLYVDDVHTYEHTSANIRAYATTLEPRFLVLDDIHLNDSMTKLWAELHEQFDHDRIYDATELTGRGYDCGFGVVSWRNPSPNDS